MTRDQLINQINSLSEFLYDDYGDTVDQLGIEETNRLEKELIDLKDQLRELS